MSMSVGCVAEIDVAVSIFIIFQRLFYKSLQAVSKVLVLVVPVLVNIIELQDTNNFGLLVLLLQL